MDKELKMLMELVAQMEEMDKRKTIEPDCVIYALMHLEDEGVRVEIGTTKPTKDCLTKELGKAYTEALDRTVKQLRNVLGDFACEIGRIGAERMDGGKYE